MVETTIVQKILGTMVFLACEAIGFRCIEIGVSHWDTEFFVGPALAIMVGAGCAVMGVGMLAASWSDH